MNPTTHTLSKEEWLSQYKTCLLGYGLDDEIAEELAQNELQEFEAGECDCLNEEPADVAREEMFAMRSEA